MNTICLITIYTYIKAVLVHFSAIPGVERVLSRQHMGAITSHKHLDTVVEGSDSRLGQRVLLDDQKRVPGATTEWAVLTGTLDAAVWVHAVCQSIWVVKKVVLLALFFLPFLISISIL